MKVLVTGASGFIGARAVARLLASGAEVVAASRSRPEVEGDFAHEAVDLIAPGAAVALAARARATHLLHLAWNATPGRFWTALDNLDWSVATLLLTRAFAEAGGERAVFAGSCAEYGWDHARLSEADAPAPATFYGRMKNATRAAVDAAGEPLGLSTAWGRVFWLYGPREKSGRLVSDVAAALARGEPALCSAGEQARDFLHVDDVAGAFVAALASPVTGAFNIGSGEAVPVRDVVLQLADAFGRRDLVRLGARPSPPDDPPELVADIARLRDEIGFRPRYDLRLGLAETAAWRLSAEGRQAK